jgi:hypothetical protein
MTKRSRLFGLMVSGLSVHHGAEGVVKQNSSHHGNKEGGREIEGRRGRVEREREEGRQKDNEWMDE